MRQLGQLEMRQSRPLDVLVKVNIGSKDWTMFSLAMISGARGRHVLFDHHVARKSTHSGLLSLGLAWCQVSAPSPYKILSLGKATAWRSRFPRILNSHGFRWSPPQDAWQRHLNEAECCAVKTVLSKLSAASA